MPEGFSSGGESSPREWVCEEQHFINGETRFPTAMSYASDAQRSDVATVCSNSVLEDIEVESVLSQEDPSTVANTAANKRSSSANGLNGSSVMVSTGTSHKHQHHVQYASTRFGSLHNDMGPPLNRTLVLRAESTSQPGSVKSFGSYTGSDGEKYAATHDEASTGNESQEAPDVAPKDDIKSVTSDSKTRGPGSVKSFDDNAGNDTDCGNSLDVETHSIETQSIHSQDGAPSPATAPIPSGENETPEESNHQESSLEIVLENGRRSPGGTIYKGRGTRRYQGRYMNLPLKRFHHNGVHVDNDQQEQLWNGEHPNNVVRLMNEQRDINGYHHHHHDHHRTNGFRTIREESARVPSRRTRSRSRSRSPSPDSKPRYNQGSTTRYLPS